MSERQKVGRALDPAKRAAHRRGKRPREERLSGAGQVLQQDVAARDEPGGSKAHHPLLADDDVVDVLFDSP